jgi:hypothetical protein
LTPTNEQTRRKRHSRHGTRRQRLPDARNTERNAGPPPDSREK